MQKPKNMFLHKLIIVLGVVAPLVGTVYAITLLWNRLVSWNDIVIMLGMYFLTGLGITIGYHRMLTHRSFEPHPVVKFIFLALGSMAVQGPAYSWAAVHIKHHAHTDEDGDPHSPLEGFFHAHVGWLFLNGLYVTGDYGKWLKKDRMVMFFNRTFLFWVVLGYVIPYLLGGWTAVLWGGLVRTFLNNHITWSVNSVCHVFGSRMFTTKDMSRNHWLVGLLAFGEGWHNNHHAFPRAAFHGMRWWQLDASALVIRLLERIGLAQKVWRVPQEKFQARLASNPSSISLAAVEEPVA
ncbi:MAG: acyl-CoA desaturase [Roseiflexaceae bacterium]|nr:acyl-CoA desaturase [Roseiflexaceae bacterium]